MNVSESFVVVVVGVKSRDWLIGSATVRTVGEGAMLVLSWLALMLMLLDFGSVSVLLTSRYRVRKSFMYLQMISKMSLVVLSVCFVERPVGRHFNKKKNE